MALRQVRKKGDELLRKKARPVGEVTDRIKLLLQDMEETMHKEGGVGIAAPQVGILKRMFIMEPVQGSPEYVTGHYLARWFSAGIHAIGHRRRSGAKYRRRTRKSGTGR